MGTKPIIECEAIGRLARGHPMKHRKLAVGTILIILCIGAITYEFILTKYTEDTTHIRGLIALAIDSIQSRIANDAEDPFEGNDVISIKVPGRGKRHMIIEPISSQNVKSGVAEIWVRGNVADPTSIIAISCDPSRDIACIAAPDRQWRWVSWKEGRAMIESRSGEGNRYIMIVNYD